MKTISAILLTAAIAVPATWYLSNRQTATPASSPASSERKVLYYQSTMHPWIKSDKPGRCTICGMELTPVYEGQKDAASRPDLVMLDPANLRVLRVDSTAARKQPLERTLVVSGAIDDDATRHRVVSAYVDGRIEKLHVNHVGAEITAGQPMISFYSQMLLVAEGEYRLLEPQRRESAVIRLRQMGLSNEQIQALPSKPLSILTSDLNAPMGGTVVAQKVYEGQYVKQGDPLFEIADFSTMWFMFDAYESDLPWLKVGQTVDVHARSLPGQEIEGKITFIDPNFDEVTRATKVRVELPNPLVDGKRVLAHRVSADAKVRVAIPEVLAIPRSAVLRTGPGSIVYVDQGGGAFQQRVIQTGRSGDQFIEVLSGLKPGDKVVTQGNLLIDGQAEINHGAGAEPPQESKALTSEEATAVKDFLALSDAMAAALGRDDLDSFNKEAATAMNTTAHFITTMKSRPDPSPALVDLEQNQHLHNAANLKEARMRFHAFITAAEVVLQPLRHTDGSPSFHVWECPMVHEAIPGSAAKGRWIQTGDRPGNNPFFGSSMPDCGEEIQP
ncbi:MAG: efflux RND transporter periplasmic adaptor subunit [Luteolibacter sp.]